MSKGFRIIWFVALAIFMATGISLAVMAKRRAGIPATFGSPSAVGTASDPGIPDPGVLGMSLPPFDLIDQDGRPVTRDALLGKVTVIDFIFTHCVLVCPAMTDTMSKVGERLAGTGVRFMSISVDPAHDTPARLKEFASVYGADFSTWSFVTGEPGVAERILTDGLKFGIGADPDPANTITLPPGSGGGTMANILHPAWFVLVGPDAKVLAIYPSSNAEQMDALVNRARAVAKGLGTR